jgi:hypothetical protein
MKQIHITLSEKAAQELEELKKSLGVGSIAEAIRSSISVTKYLEMEKQQGNEVIIRDSKTNKEKVLVTLK